MRYQGFIGPSYTLDSKAIDAQRCVNWYPKPNEMGVGKSGEKYSLITTPGLSLLSTVGSGPIRGQYKASNGALYVVSGSELYAIDSSWGSSLIGDLMTSTGKVDFADNGATCVLVDGVNGYYFTLGANSLTQITSAGWRGSERVEYLDSYFIFTDPDTGIFYISGLASIDLDPLDFASAEGAPDNIVTVLVNHREVWLFGEDSIEVWYNSGNAAFPIERISGGFIEMGTEAAHSVAKINKSIFWIGQSKDGRGIVYMAQGYAPQRISTHAIELAIQSYGDISDAKAWTYQENGHEFYVINFTAANTTWVFDLSTGLWHERAYWNGGSYERHRADNHSFFNQVHVVGDYVNGKIYKLDSSVYTDDSSTIKRLRVSPHLSNGTKRVQYLSFELEADTGIGVSGGGQNSDPKVMMQFSNDGGHTWSNESSISLGKEGEKNKRVIWRRLGMGRDRVFSISVSDPVKCNLIGAELEIAGLVS